MLHCSAYCMLPKSGRSLAVASCRAVPFHAALPSAFRVRGSLAVLCMATVKKSKRYRKPYPGEAKGIVEEIRFVAMKLRNKATIKVRQRRQKQKQQPQEVEEEEEEMDDYEEEEAGEEEDVEGEKEEEEREQEEAEEGDEEEDEAEEKGGAEEDMEGEQEAEKEGANNAEETWEPSVEGYLKYLVDSKLVFNTLDKIAAEATHVA